MMHGFRGPWRGSARAAAASAYVPTTESRSHTLGALGIAHTMRPLLAELSAARSRRGVQ